MAITAQRLTDRYAIYNGDCIEVGQSMPDRAFGLSLYSPPFAGLYHYSSDDRDLSNCSSYEQFMEHYEYVVSEIYRLTIPGRITAVHCMDIPKRGANIAGHTDFPGDVIRLHERIGFEYTPRICIWKEPLGVRNRTMAKALAHRQIVDDATLVNVAAADYLIPFRRAGKNPIPVTHPTGMLEYAGSRTPPADVLRFRGWTGNQIENRYSHWIWRQYASAFWDDIRLERVLPFKAARDSDDEKHVHPLQLDVIDRVLTLWSNPGERVWVPFAGVGSEVHEAVRMGRLPVGVELKPSYYRQMDKNVAAALLPQSEQRSMLESSADDGCMDESPEAAD